MLNDTLDISFNKHGGNPESAAAHESIVPSKAAQRAAVLRLLGSDEMGFTSDEAEQALGLRHQACSARFTELKEANLIEPVCRRVTRSGRTAMAWRAV